MDEKQLLAFLREHLTVSVFLGSEPYGSENQIRVKVSIGLKGEIISEDYDTYVLPGGRFDES